LEEVTGIWRKLDEEDHNLYASLNIIGAMRLMGHAVYMRGMTESYRFLVRNLKRQFHSENGNIEMYNKYCGIFAQKTICKPATTHYYTTVGKHAMTVGSRLNNGRILGAVFFVRSVQRLYNEESVRAKRLLRIGSC
jgi:hypothetical protein